jgi:L-ascorbate metabolism protein UlaG (beta-lactamase superfamily)
MPQLTWHGHATCTLETDDGTRIVIDPWFDENPACEIGVDEVGEVDFILVTHGHFDHITDLVPLAKRTGATVVSTFEIANFAESKGLEETHGMNVGGAYRFPFGRVKLTPALHSGSVAGDDAGAFTTTCVGFLIDFGEHCFYHAGDTALIKEFDFLRGEVDTALLPIGDNFTMGPEDAVRAVEMIQPKVVIPIHYDTFPLIEQDPERFRKMVADRSRVQILRPGQTVDL